MSAFNVTDSNLTSIVGAQDLIIDILPLLFVFFVIGIVLIIFSSLFKFGNDGVDGEENDEYEEASDDDDEDQEEEEEDCIAEKVLKNVAKKERLDLVPLKPIEIKSNKPKIKEEDLVKSKFD